MLKRILVGILLMLDLSLATPKPRLDVLSCIKEAKENYPLYKNTALIDEALSLSLDKFDKNFFLQFRLGAKVSYQSDVTTPPFTNFPFEPLDKDQYNFYAEIALPILDFNTLAQKTYEKSKSKSEQAALQNELYQVQQSVINAYFSLLLSDLQLQQNKIHLKELEKNKIHIKNLIKNGVATKEDLNRIDIEILNANTQQYEFLKQQESIFYTLSKLTSLEIAKYDLVLDEISEMESYLNTLNHLQARLFDKRPEMAYFEAKREEIEASKALEDSKSLPRMEAFVQGGYGNPALNMFKNEFESYYITGVRLNWDFGNLYSKKEQSELRRVGKLQIDSRQEEFVLNTKILLTQTSNQAQSALQRYKQSQEIVFLQENITKISQDKMQNGILNVDDFLTEINKLNFAKLTMHRSKVEFLMQVYNIRQILNFWEDL